jgi:hypothetical protein
MSDEDRVLDLATNPLLKVIKPTPVDDRRFLVLHGYISEVTEDTVTVYLELDLRSYLEIPRGKIEWAEKAIPVQDSSPTKLVINADAKVTRHTNTNGTKKTEEGFLRGMITSENLHTSAPGVQVNVSVVPEPFEFAPACPGGGGYATAKGAAGGSACRVTGVCKTDGSIQPK